MISIHSSRKQTEETLLQKAYATASNVITKHYSSALCIQRAASVNAVRLVCIPFFLSLRGSDKLRESLLFNKVTRVSRASTQMHFSYPSREHMY